ncbi:hypothetical protein CTAYLR_003337 [Chrysophaeum taylorii]|uniref:CS domain-containing protein n=1 Tax=Chrysophaeum taylorii TaxID=2483200 RepID=A0AAD7UGT9_9STRA|nr:hypothetical protein CTAYLR_003337 [Chrysophaeum taylorii]
MVLTGEYTWKETEGSVQVSVLLRGVSPKAVDVYAADVYVKISYPPCLIELDLFGEIRDLEVTAKIKKGQLTLVLPKVEPGVWGQLCVEADKAEVMKHRAVARERRQKRESDVSEKSKARKHEDQRQAVRTQMKLDEQELSAIEDRKAQEKREAEARAYQVLGRLEVTASQKRAEVPAAVPREERRDEDSLVEDDDDDDEPPALTTTSTAEKEEVTAPVLPEPRSSSKVSVAHTPRVFPTPMRESKLGDEHEWIVKHRAHLHKNAMLTLGNDGRGIEDADPTWLKARGDDRWRNGDYRSAVQAYSAALELDETAIPCLANRAAAHLKLADFAACLADCDAALASRHPRALEPKLRARRAAARCGLGDYARAVDDLEAAAAAAASAAPEDADALRRDTAKVRALRDASAFKNEADAHLAAGDAQKAEHAYARALESEPTFVSALSNRAAARLALANFRGAVQDATDALKVFERDDSTAVSGPLCVRSAGDVRPFFF